MIPTQETIDVLNRHEWAGRNDWRRHGDDAAVWSSHHRHGNYNPISYWHDEAWAIASYLQLRGRTDHPEDYCHRCGGRNITWFADSDLWNRFDPPESIICPICFVEEAEAKGVVTSAWRVATGDTSDEAQRLKTRLNEQRELISQLTTKVDGFRRQIFLVRVALMAVQGFLRMLKNHGWEAPDAAPLGDAVINQVDLTVGELNEFPTVPTYSDLGESND